MGFKVQKEMCDQCLFSENKIVSDARKKQIIKGCLEQDRNFVCHKVQLSGSKEEVCCRAFYDKFPTQNIRIAERLNMVEFVEVK